MKSYTIAPFLNQQVGIQWQGLVDHTETTANSNGAPLLVGYFKRGNPSKVIQVTKKTIQIVLGYEPNNPHYQQALFLLNSGVTPLNVLSLGSLKAKEEPKPTPKPEEPKPTPKPEEPKPTPSGAVSGSASGGSYNGSNLPPVIVNPNSPDYPSGDVDGFYDTSLAGRTFQNAFWSPKGDRLAVIEIGNNDLKSLVIFDFDPNTRIFTEYPRIAKLTGGLKFTSLARAVFSNSGNTLLIPEFSDSGATSSNKPEVRILQFDLSDLKNIKFDLVTVTKLKDASASANPISLTFSKDDKNLLISTYFGKANYSTEATCFYCTYDEKTQKIDVLSKFAGSDYCYGVAMNETQDYFLAISENRIYRYVNTSNPERQNVDGRSYFNLDDLGLAEHNAQGIFNVSDNKFIVNFATGDLMFLDIVKTANENYKPTILRDIGDINQVSIVGKTKSSSAPLTGLAVSYKGAKVLYLENKDLKMASISASDDPEVLKSYVSRKINPSYSNYVIAIENNTICLHHFTGATLQQYHPTFKKAK